ncbi:pseudouridine-metabolizing bifunctional protein c1861.05-like [Columba guinea]|nr:pseudouridine-metabolizing bifunctional protein c1861.05-like [Columba guinea]
MHKMIRKITYSLGRHVYAVVCGTTQVRRFLHGACFKIQPSVQEALMEGRAVVALESTIITHGMAYPQNLSMAREVEEIVTANGAVPATVGILRGRIHVGLTDEELEFLASSKNVVKVSRRDLPFILSQGLSGGTTVSGTMIAAHKAGIPVFVTGGIGGVHRGGENTLDVSADLTELGRTPVAVVSAGVKSILDIGRTLEYLETQGVCVAAFGESREFPAFFSRQSGFQAPYHVRNEEEAAELIASAQGLGLSNGVLIAVPCPQERAASGQVIEEATQQALSEARSKGITGKELTPFMLQKINELTDGKSLDSSILLLNKRKEVVIGGVNVDFIAKALNPVILVLNNQEAEVEQTWDFPMHMTAICMAYTIFVELYEVLQMEVVKLAQMSLSVSNYSVLTAEAGWWADKCWKSETNLWRRWKKLGRCLVLGFACGLSLCLQYSNGFINILCFHLLLDCLSRLGLTPLFLSAIGKDEHSESLLNYCHHMDMSTILQLEGKSTATYCAVVTSAGELSVGLGDMDIHQQITEQYVSQFKENLCQAPLVCIDGNVPLSTIQYVCQLAREHQLADEPLIDKLTNQLQCCFEVCYEPTDENKASKPFLSDSWKALTYISPNLQELRAINRTLGNPLPAGIEYSEESVTILELPSRLEDVLQTAMALARPLLAHLHCVVVTLGAHGVLLCGKSLGGSISLCPGAHEKTAAASLCATHYPAIHISREEIVNVSGAGDSLMAGILAGMLAQHDTDTCVRMGLLAASLSLRSYEPISPNISTSSVNQEQVKSRSWPEVQVWKMD